MAVLFSIEAEPEASQAMTSCDSVAVAAGALLPAPGSLVVIEQGQR